MVNYVINSIGAVFSALLDTTIEVFSININSIEDFDSRFVNEKEKEQFYTLVEKLSKEGDSNPATATIGNKKTSIIVD